MCTEKADGTLIVPVWKSSPYWPLLYPNGSLADFIKGTFLFQKISHILPGQGNNGVFVNNAFNFQMVACLLSFKDNRTIIKP